MIKEITLEFLKEKSACGDGVEWFKAQKKTASIDVLHALIADDKIDWANWLIVRTMERKQYLAYIIYAAEQVLSIYEKGYPKDKRPRLAIQAAKAVLKNDTEENRKKARDAAYAASSAAYAASSAAYAVYAAYAPYAAYAASSAAYAASSAAYAAYAPYSAPAAAYAAACKKMKLKILKHGLKLLAKEN